MFSGAGMRGAPLRAKRFRRSADRPAGIAARFAALLWLARGFEASVCWRPRRRPRASADADGCVWPVGEPGGNVVETVCQRRHDSSSASGRGGRRTSQVPGAWNGRSEGAKLRLRASGAGRRRLASRRPRVACSSRVFGPALRCGDRQQRGARERPCPRSATHKTDRAPHGFLRLKLVLTFATGRRLTTERRADSRWRLPCDLRRQGARAG